MMKISIKTSIFLFFLLTTYIVQAQSYMVKGYVKNEAGKPVPQASITVGYEMVRVPCDDEGVFEVALPKGITAIVVKSVGYLGERFALTVNGDTTITVVLKEVTNQLEQVVISGDRGNDNIRKPVGIAQLNTKVLKKIPAAFGETDLLRGLQMLPGVSTVGEASNGINVRGGATDHRYLIRHICLACFQFFHPMRCRKRNFIKVMCRLVLGGAYPQFWM
jgi:hypothetical protein